VGVCLFFFGVCFGGWVFCVGGGLGFLWFLGFGGKFGVCGGVLVYLVLSSPRSGGESNQEKGKTYYLIPCVKGNQIVSTRKGKI